MQNITRSNMIRLWVAKIKGECVKEQVKEHPLRKKEYFATLLGLEQR